MNEVLVSSITETLEKLQGKKGFATNMILGLDGFVDEIIHAVATRMDFDNFARIKTINEIGTRITKASGLSTNIEFVTQNTKLGGNGPILANALLELGTKLTYIGALGEYDIHPVFKAMAEKCEKVYSLTDPGHTDALEFDDGKLMFGKMLSLYNITWDRFKEKVGSKEKIAELIADCDLLGMENWTMIPYMSQVWKGLIDEVLPLLPDKAVKPIAFFDLADPEKRTSADILEAMKLIAAFGSKFRSVLGLNEKELYEIAEVVGVVPDQSLPKDQKLIETGKEVYKRLGIHCLVVHLTKEAYAFVENDYFHTEGPYCPKPVLTTGAGDNFNSGFCMGMALGLDPLSCLTMGVGVSGYYVRNAKSPSFEALCKFLTEWKFDFANN